MLENSQSSVYVTGPSVRVSTVSYYLSDTFSAFLSVRARLCLRLPWPWISSPLPSQKQVLHLQNGGDWGGMFRTLPCWLKRLASKSSSLPRFYRGKAHKYFRHERRLDWPDRHTSRESIRAVHCLPRLRDLVRRHVDDKAVGLFMDLLERMFSYDPSNRPTAKEALRHPFFQVSSGR